MNIRVITGLYATPSIPTGGVFVYERLKQLREQGISYITYAIGRTDSRGVSLLYRVLMRKPLFIQAPISWNHTETIYPILCSMDVLGLLLSILYPKQYLKRGLKFLSDKIDIQSDTIIHAHWVYPHGYYGAKLAKKYGVPCVITAHGSDIHTIPQRNHIVKKFTVEALSSADKVIFVSYALLNSAKALGYSGDNAIVIPNGIDPEYFFPVNQTIAVQKTGWQRTHKYVVGYVGNLVPVKRADNFPIIFENIRDTLKDVEFILVGDGFLKNSIKNQCEERQLHVTFVGQVPHEAVAYWMSLFDVMIFPSRNEGWGCVILEAYACGVPVIGSHIGGIPEAIGGLCPTIAEGDDFEKRFAAEVCDVLMGTYAVDSEMLIKRAKEYTWKECVKKEIDVYNEIRRDNIKIKNNI